MDNTVAEGHGETLPEEDWHVCPFCARTATRPTTPKPHCESRTCRCGAVVLGAPVGDIDEITDDAIGLFGVAIRPESTGSEVALRQEILRAGVAIRAGVVRRVELGDGVDRRVQYVWFRRQDSGDGAGPAAQASHRDGH
jgi:hypothetical protein